MMNRGDPRRNIRSGRIKGWQPRWSHDVALDQGEDVIDAHRGLACRFAWREHGGDIPTVPGRSAETKAKQLHPRLSGRQPTFGRDGYRPGPPGARVSRSRNWRRPITPSLRSQNSEVSAGSPVRQPGAGGVEQHDAADVLAVDEVKRILPGHDGTFTV